MSIVSKNLIQSVPNLLLDNLPRELLVGRKDEAPYDVFRGPIPVRTECESDLWRFGLNVTVGKKSAECLFFRLGSGLGDSPPF